MIKKVFNLFLMFSFTTLFAQEQGGDTVYIKSEPIIIKKQVYYAKPLDKTFFHNAVQLQVNFTPLNSSTSEHSEYNKVNITEKGSLLNQLELSYQRRSKKLNGGFGIGFQTYKSQISQESFFFSKIDSSQQWKTDTLDEYYVESSKKTDTIYITDSIQEWRYKENGKSYTTQSNLSSNYIYLPLYFGIRFEKNKFIFGINTILQSFVSIKKSANVSMIDANETNVDIEKNLLRTAFFKVCMDFSFLYSINKHIYLQLNYRPNYQLLSMYKWQEIKQNKLTNSFGFGSTYIF
jgi:hypothetical protein